MGDFLKGAIIGTLAGVCVGAIVVAKNKKLSNKLKEGIDTAEEKFEKIKKGFEDGSCSSGSCFINRGDEMEDMSDITEKSNFSKKTKNN